MRVIDYRSDTVTRPSREMREVMMEAEVGDDVFGEDPTVNRLQERVAAMFGKEAGLFVASGTMGNQICVKLHTSPGNEMICEADCHIFKYEAGATGLFAGIQVHTLPGRGGVLTAEQIERAINPNDIHSSPTSLVTIENTHNRAGGTLFPIDEMRRIHELTRKRSLRFHLDGARIFNAMVATGTPASEYGRNCDTASVCFSKGLGAPVGSVVIGSREHIERARYYRKALGGGMRQAGIVAAGALYALDHHVEKLRVDHERAQTIAHLLSTLPEFQLDPGTVQTNIVIFECVRRSADEVAARLASHGLLCIPFGPTRIRLVTHLDLSDDDIQQTLDILKKHFR